MPSSFNMSGILGVRLVVVLCCVFPLFPSIGPGGDVVEAVGTDGLTLILILVLLDIGLGLASEALGGAAAVPEGLSLSVSSLSFFASFPF